MTGPIAGPRGRRLHMIAEYPLAPTPRALHTCHTEREGRFAAYPSQSTLRRTATGLIFLACWLTPIASTAALENLSRNVFVSSPESKHVAVIDTDRDEVVGSFTLTSSADELIVSETERLLIARSQGEQTLETIALGTLSRDAWLVLAPTTPRHMRLGAEGHVLAVSDYTRDEVILIELPGLVVRHRLRAHQASYMSFDRDSVQLFVASLDGREVSVINLRDGSLEKTITLDADGPPGPVTGFVRTPGGGFGFVLHGDRGLMSVIDLGVRKWLRAVALDVEVARAYPTMNSQYILVPDRASAAITLISTWTYAEVWRVDAATDVVDVDTAFFDSLAFAQSATESKTVVLNIEDRSRLGDISLPAQPSNALASSNGLKLYVGLPALSQVAIIDVTSMTIIGRIGIPEVVPVTLSAVSDKSYCH